MNLLYTDPNIVKVNRQDPKLANAIVERGGFIVDDEVARLIEIDRMMIVMVRCGCGRFMCPVQDMKHFINILERDAKANDEKLSERTVDTDYVRDVSLCHNVKCAA